MITTKTNIAPAAPAELIGDPHPLLEQLGSADGLAMSSTVSATIEFRGVRDLPSLRRFLEAYQAQILTPVELPVIATAFAHASRNELRELLSLDARLVANPLLRDFATASYRVGQRQLSRLRPLRDEKLVQRYLVAIESGEARGWHTLVYGLSLAVYSMPLRQGLQNYAEQTISGFISSAAKSLRLAQADCESLFLEQVACVPRCIETTLSATEPRVCDPQHLDGNGKLRLTEPRSV